MLHGAGASFLLVSIGIARPEQGLDFWLPMSFLVVGAVLFLWELSMPGFFVAVPATVLVILGIVGLSLPGLYTAEPLGPIWAILVAVIVGAPATMVTLRVYRSFAPPDAPPTTTSAETMRGRHGTVMVAADPETTRGKVRVEGVVWSARSLEGTIAVDTRVEVVDVRGVHVVVRPATSPSSSAETTAPEGAGSAG